LGAEIVRELRGGIVTLAMATGINTLGSMCVLGLYIEICKWICVEPVHHKNPVLVGARFYDVVTQLK
jgi:hypothetical protein